MWRRAARSALPRSCAMSSCRPSSSSRMRPAVGSTSRLMQRISVLLPVPEGPMMLVSPVPDTARSMPLSTGWPGRYSLTSCSMRRLPAVALACMDRSVSGLLLGRGLVVGIAREQLAGRGRHGAHQLPVLLVRDRQEAVAAQALGHLSRDLVVVEALLDLGLQRRLPVVCVGVGVGGELAAGVEHAELVGLDHAAVRHVLQHVAGHRCGVVVAGLHAQDGLVVLAGVNNLVLLFWREAEFW